MSKEVFVLLVHNASLLLALGLLYETITSCRHINRSLLPPLNGIIIGIIGILLMLSPLHPVGGVHIDSRSILLSVSGLFFGFIPTLTALFMTSLFRIFLDGIGVWPGIAIISTSAAVGLTWRSLMPRNSSRLKTQDLYIFGFTTHVVMLLCLSTFSAAITRQILSGISLSIMIIFPVATVLLGKLMMQQLKRHEMEDALRESESRYKSLFNNHHQIMLLIDPEQDRIEDANPAACTFYGRTREEFLKMHFSQLNPLPRDNVFSEMQQAPSGKRKVFILKHRRADDTIRDVEIYSGPIQIKGRTLLYALVHDITDHKRVEEALITEKERLAVTLRSIDDGVITTDTQGAVVLMNKAAEEMTGWPLAEAEGTPLTDVFRIINEHTRQPCENPVEKVLRTNANVEIANHTLLISRKKKERIIADSAAPIHDKARRIIGVVLVFRDITGKQKMLEAMQRSEKLDSLGVLAGGIAHDFNNLLSGIFGYIDMARTRSGSDELLNSYLDGALEANSRARDLTQQLLTFSKGGTPRRRPVSLEPFLKKNVKFALSGSNVTSQFDIADQLGCCEVDEHQMAQVIDNIIINAQQAMPGGGTIFISAHGIECRKDVPARIRKGKYCRISIRDHGPGIPAKQLKRIFDPFFTTKEKGSGLGLAICHSIIQQHDGVIDVESEPQKGTTFHIFLPISDQQVTEPSPFSPSAVSWHNGQGHILIMDDEAAIREVLSTMLEAMGYTVSEVTDGREALKALREKDEKKKSIDAVILDMTVPGGMGGMETIAEIRRTHPTLPVFASSGYAENPTMSQPVQYGFTDSLSKPYTIADLTELLNQHLTPKDGRPPIPSVSSGSSQAG